MINVLPFVLPKNNRYTDTKTLKGERPKQPLIDYAFRFSPIFGGGGSVVVSLKER